MKGFVSGMSGNLWAHDEDKSEAGNVRVFSGTLLGLVMGSLAGNLDVYLRHLGKYLAGKTCY